MKKEITIGLFAQWTLIELDGTIYIPTIHFLYLKFVSQEYSKVYLICPLRHAESFEKDFFVCNYMQLDFSNVVLAQLPFSSNYFQAMKHFGAYRNVLLRYKDIINVFYCRVPDPFSWMPALFLKKRAIMHFVGDTIDATKHNEKWSWLKKKVMIAGYLPEYFLTLLAARRSRVFTNGPHLAKKLKRFGIKASPVISSTVYEADLNHDFTSLPLNKGNVVITYVGYVRYAKGMNCLMDFCKKLRLEKINFHFHLIGDGEMYKEVDTYLVEEKLCNHVTLHGHIGNKDEINKLLRASDLFFFPSLSEGSPRVVIEAMAQGVPVMSTPVGSLPSTFTDGENIRFFDFNDASKAVSIVKEFVSDPLSFEKQRENAFNMVKERFTIEQFLSKVFKYEE